YSPTRYLSINLQHSELYNLLDGEQTASIVSTSLLLDYIRIKHHRFNVWWGGGVSRQLSDDRAFGMVLHTGFHWFVHKPVSLYSDISFTIALDDRFHWQTRLQWHRDRFVLYGGHQMNYLFNRSWHQLIIGGGVYF
ncbi:MAG: hypothetical protein AAFO94_17265, partial [Bacteroidota bacterium]